MLWKFEASNLLKEFELSNNPIVVTVNKFDEQSSEEFRNKFSMAQNTGQKVIPVVIDSYGGQVYSLMSMMATIRASPLPVATIAEGKAMSCGAVLLTCGEEGMRFMDPDATVMIHDVASGQYGKNEEIQASAAETARLNKKIFRIMSRNCGKSDDYFINEIHSRGHADWFLEADECKKIGMINHTRVPKINVKIDVSIEFE
jgi:ATP-dependent Clp protease protease subunit|tara:strand:- start:7 stop:609 length:603 start_codon:yes stop_codon:yes gene_type:complete